MSVRFFNDPRALRRWLQSNHATESELWIGFYRKGTGPNSLEYPEAVDAALCFGWIDGIRKKRDDTTYVNRFTPRMETGASSVVRRHFSSQVWKQTREQIAANGFRSRCSFRASA